MAKKAPPCRCKPQECEECPEWIFTFADLVMLMMGFFVILWVLKPAPNPKAGGSSTNEEWINTAAAIRDAFGYVPNPASSDPVDARMLFQKLNGLKVPDGPGKGGQTKVHPQGADGTDREVTSVRPGKQAVVGGRLLFEKADFKLVPGTLRMADEIADQIRGHRNIFLVKGHSSLDDFDEKATAEQKMDLSLRRAQTVADYLTAHGVSPDILRVQGCSTFEPVVQREYTPDSQSVNRRVEVESTPTLVADLQQNTNSPTSSPIKADAPASQSSTNP